MLKMDWSIKSFHIHRSGAEALALKLLLKTKGPQHARNKKSNESPRKDARQAIAHRFG
jgi:hypothetical protein